MVSIVYCVCVFPLFAGRRMARYEETLHHAHCCSPPPPTHSIKPGRPFGFILQKYE